MLALSDRNISYQSINVSNKSHEGVTVIAGREHRTLSRVTNVPLQRGLSQSFLYDNDERLHAPRLPHTIYSSALVSTLGFDRDQLWRLDTWILLLPNWFMVGYNYVFSLSILYYINGISNLTPVCVVDRYLLFLCMIAFTTFSLGEIYETLALFHWIYCQPEVEHHEMLTMASDEDGLGLHENIVSGMTFFYKKICYFTLVVPKLCLGLLVLWYGNVFLLVSDTSQDCILHAMSIRLLTKVHNDCNYYPCILYDIYIYIYCTVVKLQLVMWCLSFLLDPHCNIYMYIYV